MLPAISLKHRFLALISCAPFFISCSNAENEKAKNIDSEPKATVVRTLTAGTYYSGLSSPGNNVHYDVYLPKGFKRDKQQVTLIFLDPHADASVPLKKYEALADKYNFMLIGSNDVKNGISLEDGSTLVDALVQEVKSSFYVDPLAISIAGFSGGAKAALAAAYQLPGFSTVIYCGAAFPPDFRLVSIPSMGISGTSDMNLTEVLYYYSSLDSIKSRHSLIVTKSKHEWPDESAFEQAFAWCMTSRCISGGYCDKVALQNLLDHSFQIAQKEQDPVFKNLFLQHQYLTYNGLLDITNIERVITQNQNTIIFKERYQSFLNELSRETSMRQMYQEAFASKDLLWWLEQVRSLNARSADPVNVRLLNFLSLASYSYSRQSLKEVNLVEADKFLSLYKAADPKNSEWAFLRACYDAEAGKNSEIIRDLQTSVKLGMNDPEKIRKEPLLAGVLNTPDVQALLRSLDKK